MKANFHLGDLAFQPRIRLKSESANERDDPQVLNQKSLPIKVDSGIYFLLKYNKIY